MTRKGTSDVLKKEVQLSQLRKLLPTSKINKMKVDTIGNVRWESNLQANFLRTALFTWTMNKLVRASIASTVARKSRTVTFLDVMNASKTSLDVTRMQLPRSLANCANVITSLDKRMAVTNKRFAGEKGYNVGGHDIHRQNVQCIYFNKSRFHSFFQDLILREYRDMSALFSSCCVGTSLVNASAKYPFLKASYVRSLMKMLVGLYGIKETTTKKSGSDVCFLYGKKVGDTTPIQYVILGDGSEDDLKALKSSNSKEIKDNFSGKLKVNKTAAPLRSGVTNLLELIHAHIKLHEDFQDRMKEMKNARKNNKDSPALKMQSKILDIAYRKISAKHFEKVMQLMDDLQTKANESYKNAKASAKDNKLTEAQTVKRIQIMPRLAVNKIASLHAQFLVENIMKQFIISVRDQSLNRSSLKKSTPPKSMRLIESIQAMADIREMPVRDYARMINQNYTIKGGNSVTPTPAAGEAKEATVVKSDGPGASAVVDMGYRSSSPSEPSSVGISSPQSALDDFSGKTSENWYSFVGESDY